MRAIHGDGELSNGFACRMGLPFKLQFLGIDNGQPLRVRPIFWDED